MKKTLKKNSSQFSFLSRENLPLVRVVFVAVITAAIGISLLFINPLGKQEKVGTIFASSSNPCASAACGKGGYCGGNCGVTGPNNYVYQCSGTDGVMTSEEYCNYGCYTNPSGSDRCNSGQSATQSSGETYCGYDHGYLTQPGEPSTQSVTIYSNYGNVNNNWIMILNSNSSSCQPTPTPPPACN